MAQAPTYNDIRANQQAQAQAASAAQAQQATGQQVQGEVQSNKNAILQDYMNKQRGLGNPNAAVNDYAMIATEVANNSANESEYTQNMIALANAGKLPREIVMSDPVVQQVMEAQQAPVGLGQVR